MAALEYLESSQQVFNLEVEADHEYLVGQSAVRVHNTYDEGVPSRGYDRPEVETRSGTAVTDRRAVDDWDDFLGPDQTGIDPRDGLPDPDRIWSGDGRRSIRYGPHEMGSRPNRQHYHRETWSEEGVRNELQRVQRTR